MSLPPARLDDAADPWNRRIALAIALLSVVVLAIVAPTAGQPWASAPAFVSARQSAVVVNNLVTAALLFTMWQEQRGEALLLLGAGYLCTPSSQSRT